jgi:hypothetical protein
MFPISWGGVWDYPYPEAQELIRGMRDLFGASKLVGVGHAECRALLHLPPVRRLRPPLLPVPEQHRKERVLG